MGEKADEKRRRKGGEGTMPREVKPGLWRVNLSLGVGPDGRRIRPTIYGKTERECLRNVREAVRKHEEGQRHDAGRESVAQFLTRWLADFVHPYREPLTYRQYEYICRVHLIPALGRIPLAKLTPQDVQALITKKKQTHLSPRTVALIRDTLRAALARAEIWGVVHRNVAALVEVPARATRPARPLTLAEIDDLQRAIAGERLEALYVATLATALREGEVLGLHWDDVDFEAGTITVRTQVQRNGNGLVIKKLKTPSSQATIPLPGFAAEKLREHRARQREERLRARLWQEQSLVFPNTQGGPIEPRNLVRQWERIRDRAGLGERHFHDLRHTTASLLHARGVSMKDIQTILRHSQISITNDLYTHVFMPQLQTAADALDAVLRNGKTQGGGTRGGTDQKTGD